MHELPLLTFLRCKMARWMILSERIFQQIWIFSKRFFSSKSDAMQKSCFKFRRYAEIQFSIPHEVNILIWNLASCRNLHSKNYELWKSWLQDTLVLKFLIQNLFCFPVFFSQIHSLQETTTLLNLIFSRFKMMQKTIFWKQKFL